MTSLPARAALRSLQLTWLAFLVSALIYGIVIRFLVPTVGSWKSIIARDAIQLSLQIAAISIFLIAMATSRLLMRKASSLRPRITPVFEVTSSIRQALMIRWAMFESVAVLGFISAFIGRQSLLITPFLLASLIGFLSSFPSEKFIRTAQGEIV